MSVLGLWTDGECASSAAASPLAHASSAPAVPQSPRRAPTWVQWTDGFIPAGDDLFFQNTTVRGAEALCAATDGCAGFTYQGPATPPGEIGVYFKSAWSFEAAAGWTSWQLQLHRRITYVGDSITAGTGAVCANGGGGDCDVQDHSATYASYLAQNFSATEEALAFPGKGLVSRTLNTQSAWGARDWTCLRDVPAAGAKLLRRRGPDHARALPEDPEHGPGQ